MPKTKLTKEQELTIIKLYDNGKGLFCKEIARKLGVRHQVITNCLRRNNIEVIHRHPGAVGEQNARWQGGIRYIKGYKHILMPEHPDARKDGYIAEHRFVMAEILGRRLLESEVVHHKNHDILDNSDSNLELVNDQSKHMKSHTIDFLRDSFGKFIKGKSGSFLSQSNTE